MRSPSTIARAIVIWIHDYHLMLVPGLLRSYLPDAEIGFFLHVPFPAVDIFRILPWRHEMLQGLLGATLLGFHTGGYASHFLDAVRSLTALEVDGGLINGATRSARVGVYPMGADVASFARMPDTRMARDARRRFLVRRISRSCSAWIGWTTRRASPGACWRMNVCCGITRS